MSQSTISLNDLNDRILQGRSVREENVWSYLKSTGSCLCDRHHKQTARLQTFLNADAILDALLLIAREDATQADLRSFHFVGDGWLCSAARSATAKPFKVQHRTLEGAVFTAVWCFTRCSAFIYPSCKIVNMQVMKGVLTPIVTPFKGGEVDFPAFDHLVKWQAHCGVSGLVLNTLTGEGPTISDRERRSLISRAVKLYQGHGVIIVATGTYCTETTIRRIEEAHQLGADFSLVVQPYYNCPTQKGIIHHFEQIAANTKLPVFLDNDPQHAGTIIKGETLAAILLLPHIIGVLEDEPSLRRADPARPPFPGRSLQISQEDATRAGIHLSQSYLVSPLANVVPESVVRAQKNLASDFPGSIDCQGRLLKLNDALCFDDVALIKQAVSCVRGICKEVRLPLMPASEETACSIKSALYHLRCFEPRLSLSSLVEEAQAARAFS